MLQGRLGDAVSREMRGWPCSQITLRRFLLLRKGDHGAIFTVSGLCLAVQTLRAVGYIWGDISHMMSQEDV